jgi:hypothetical protein
MSKRPAEGAAEGEREIKRVKGLPALIERARDDPSFADLPNEILVGEILEYIDRPKEIGAAAQINQHMAHVLGDDANHAFIMWALFDRHYRSPMTRKPYAVCAVVRAAVGAIVGIKAAHKADLAYSLMSQVLRTTVENMFYFEWNPWETFHSGFVTPYEEEYGMGLNTIFMCRAIPFEPIVYIGRVEGRDNPRIWFPRLWGTLDIADARVLEEVPERIMYYIRNGNLVVDDPGDRLPIVNYVKFSYHGEVVGNGYALVMPTGDWTDYFVTRLDAESIWQHNTRAKAWRRRIPDAFDTSWDVGAYIALTYKPLAFSNGGDRIYYRSTLVQ